VKSVVIYFAEPYFNLPPEALLLTKWQWKGGNNCKQLNNNNNKNYFVEFSKQILLPLWPWDQKVHPIQYALTRGGGGAIPAQDSSSLTYGNSQSEVMLMSFPQELHTGQAQCHQAADQEPRQVARRQHPASSSPWHPSCQVWKRGDHHDEGKTYVGVLVKEIHNGCSLSSLLSGCPSWLRTRD
jgi:hypothetical protein